MGPGERDGAGGCRRGPFGNESHEKEPGAGRRPGLGLRGYPIEREGGPH